MNPRFAIRLSFVLTALAVMPLLSACDTVADDETVAQNPPPQYVSEAPPEPQVEARPMIEDPPHQIWRPGYWAMINHSFVWIPGAVIARPAPTAVWASAHWTHHTYGWSFQQGHWE